MLQLIRLFALVLGAIMLVCVSAPSRVMAQQSSSTGEGRQTSKAAARVLKLDTLTRQEFDALPDSQAIEINGRRTTKGALLAVAERQRDHVRATAEESQPREVESFKTARAQFLQQQQADLEARNAEVRAEAQRRLAAGEGRDPWAAFEKIYQETIELQNRYRKATPEERERIERRASELLSELRRLGF